MIVKEGNYYYVKSEKGMKLGGPYRTRKRAKKRLAQVEMFKHMSQSKAMALWANDVQRRCLLECGEDISAALAAAEIIVTSEQMPEDFFIPLSTDRPSREDYEHEDYHQHYASLQSEAKRGNTAKASHEAHEATLKTSEHRGEMLPVEGTAAQHAVRASADALAKGTSTSKDKPAGPRRYAEAAHLKAANYHHKAASDNETAGFDEIAKLHRVAKDKHLAAAKYHKPASSEDKSLSTGDSTKPTQAHLDAVHNAVLKHERGINLAKLVHVRPELEKQGMTREQQDAAINHLRRQNKIQASGLEGRHGTTPEEREAAIKEGDNVLGHLLFVNPEAARIRGPRSTPPESKPLSTDDNDETYEEASKKAHEASKNANYHSFDGPYENTEAHHAKGIRLHQEAVSHHLRAGSIAKRLKLGKEVVEKHKDLAETHQRGVRAHHGHLDAIQRRQEKRRVRPANEELQARDQGVGGSQALATDASDHNPLEKNNTETPQHTKTVEEFEHPDSESWSLPVEHVVLRAANGNHIHYTGNSAKEVTLPEEHRHLLKDAVYTHNHPTGTNVLSVSDVNTAVHHNVAEMRAITHNRNDNKRYIMSIKRPEGGWHPDMVTEYNQAKDKILREATYSPTMHQQIADKMHLALGTLANKYGAAYERKVLE